jgi:hypothetical protein
MSRSNPVDGARNPSTRWFEWAGGSEGGFVRWYNKETEKHEQVNPPFTFLLLDELSTVKGWHEPSESGIFANEVRDMRQDALVVRSFKGGELASGIYTTIRDRIIAIGGHYSASIYIAYKDGEELRIGNLQLKGAALSAWMDFKKAAGTKKDANGKQARAYFVDAVQIIGHEQQKKGGTVYRVPKFALKETSAATNQQAVALDAELQAFLSEYLKRPKAEAVKQPETSTHEPPPPDEGPARHFDDLADNCPF